VEKILNVQKTDKLRAWQPPRIVQVPRHHRQNHGSNIENIDK